MLRLIREQEAPTPSSRLSSNEAKPTVAANRQMEPAKLRRFVKGELDWIAMKCLEKDRSRRYETANGLSMDIQRYLADEPVAAGPPSATYRLRKFVKKHRGPVVAGLTVLLLLVLGIAGTSWGLVQARAQRDRAEEARKAEAKRAESERRAKEDAETARDNEARERVYAEAITAFVKDDFLALTSVEGQGRFGGEELTRNATLRELLDRAAEKLKVRKNLAPRTEAELNWIIGVSYRALGEYLRAIPFLERSVELHRQAFGPEAQATLNAQNSLGLAYRVAGQYERALPLFEETIKLVKVNLGPDHPNTLTIMNHLARAYQDAGKLDKALPLFEEALKLRKAKLGADHLKTLDNMNNLAHAYTEAGRLDLSLPLAENTFKLAKTKLGPDNPGTRNTMNGLTGAYQNAMLNLATAYQAAGKLDLALPLFEETLKLQKAKLGPDHPDTLTTMGSLASAYRAAGKLDLALPLFEETLKLQKAKLGYDHPNTLNTMNNLASAYRAAGKLDLALPLFEETLKLQKAKINYDHPNTLNTMNNLALAYLDSGKLDLALPLFEETLKLQKAKLGLDCPDTLNTMNNVALAYKAARKLDLALPLFEETLKLKKAKLGPDHPDTLTTMGNLASAYLDAGKLHIALPLFEETLKLQKAKLGPDHPGKLMTMNNLAAAYWKQRQLDKSIPLFEETLKRREAKLGRQHPATLETIGNLGVNYKDSGRFAEAIPLLEEAYLAAKKYPSLRWVGGQLIDAYIKAGENAKLANLLLEHLPEARKALPKDSPQLAGLLAQIGMGLLEQKKWAEAEPLLRECLAIREKTQAENWLTFNTKSMLGEALVGQKKYAEAEPLLLAGYEGMKKREKTIPPQGSNRIREAIDRLVQLYVATGKKDDAAKWRSELAKYPEVAPMPREKSPQTAYTEQTVEGFQKTFDQLVPKGWRLKRIKGYEKDGASRLDSVWYKPAVTTTFWCNHNMDRAGYEVQSAKLTKSGYTEVLKSTWKLNGEDRFWAVWEIK